jgi:hypothetical protein
VRQARAATVRRVAGTLGWLLGLCHWCACGWLALDGIGAEDAPAARYLHALYWAVTALTAVGYGDIRPTTDAQVAYSILVAFISLGVYGYLVGHLMRRLVYLRILRRGVVSGQHPDRL